MVADPAGVGEGPVRENSPTRYIKPPAAGPDLAYGQSACKKLAKRPKRAIRNADSHEYFAENTPALP